MEIRGRSVFLTTGCSGHALLTPPPEEISENFKHFRCVFHSSHFFVAQNANLKLY